MFRKIFALILMCLAVPAGLACGQKSSSVVNAPVAAPEEPTPAKPDPVHVRAIEKIRAGSEAERDAAAEELRKAGPAAFAISEGLCEFTTKPDRRIQALLALETVAPKLFGPVRTLTTSDDYTAETKAAADLGAMGPEARPAAVVLRWHLARSSERAPKKVPDVGRMLADIGALALIAPHDAEVLKTVKGFLTFNADNNTPQLRAGVAPLLAQIADAVPEHRAEIAGILTPLLDDNDLRLRAIAALPACAQEGAAGRTKLGKLRFDPSEEVKKAADTALAEIDAAEKAWAKITDRSVKALSPQAFDPADRLLRQLAREGLRKIHHALEVYARRLGEDLIADNDSAKHIAALNELKPEGAPPEAAAQIILAHMKRVEKIPDSKPGFGEPDQHHSLVIHGVSGQALLRLAPKTEETRKTLIVLSRPAASRVFGSTMADAIISVRENEIHWFGDELLSHFPNDKEVEELIMDAGETTATAKVGWANRLMGKAGSQFVQSVGKLALAKPEMRKPIAQLLERILNGQRFGPTGNGYLMSGVEPNALADALIACGEEASAIVAKAKTSFAYKNGDTEFTRPSHENFRLCIDRASAKLAEVKSTPKVEPK